MKISIFTKIVIIASSIITIALSGLFINHKIVSYENTIYDLYNQIAQKDSIVKLTNNSYSKLAISVDKLKSENENLNKKLKKSDATILSQLNLIGTLNDSLLNISTEWNDTIFVNDSGDTELQYTTRIFNVTKNTLNIRGYFQVVEPYNLFITSFESKFDLEVNIVENKNKTFSTFVYSKNDNVVFDNISTKLIPYKQEWYKKIQFAPGIVISNKNLMVNTIIGYNKYTFMIGYGTYNGMNIGFNYFLSK
jgi:hypothetical protein